MFGHKITKVYCIPLGEWFHETDYKFQAETRSGEMALIGTLIVEQLGGNIKMEADRSQFVIYYKGEVPK